MTLAFTSLWDEREHVVHVPPGLSEDARAKLRRELQQRDLVIRHAWDWLASWTQLLDVPEDYRRDVLHEADDLHRRLLWALERGEREIVRTWALLVEAIADDPVVKVV